MNIDIPMGAVMTAGKTDSITFTVPPGRMISITLASGDYVNLTEDGRVILESSLGDYEFTIPALPHDGKVIQMRKWSPS